MSTTNAGTKKASKQRNIDDGEDDRSDAESTQSRGVLLEESSSVSGHNRELLNSFIQSNDPKGLKRFLSSFKLKEDLKAVVNRRDETGKSPLDIAASLGRVTITTILLEHGANIDSTNGKGYTCLHHAAAWGQLPALKVLAENGGSLQKQTIYCESPGDIAARYQQQNCLDYLEGLGERRKLQEEITRLLDKFRDEKMTSGKITKEEKNMVVSLCMETQEWLHQDHDGSSADVLDQLARLANVAESLELKLGDSQKSVNVKAQNPKPSVVPPVASPSRRKSQR